MIVNSDNIPAALKERRQWVLWRSEAPQLGNKGKAPYQLNGHHARTDDPTTWMSFEQGIEAYRRRKRYDGIGFVFSPDDDVIGVDLDGFRDPLTGTVNEPAHKIIDHLDSYTEVSPSGRGIHVLLRGMLPGTRRRKGISRFMVLDAILPSPAITLRVRLLTLNNVKKRSVHFTIKCLASYNSAG